MSNKPTKVLFKRNSTPNTPPTPDKLVPGELALNTADGKIYTKTDGGVVIDTNKQIFQRNTNVTVNDDGTNPGSVITNVDGVPTLTIDPSSATLDADLVMVGGRVISLHELVGNGTNKVSISAPDNVPLDYTLKLPQVQGTAGQVMAIGEDGQMEFVAPDRFGGNRVYVSADRGDDANDGINAPVASVKRAAQIASELIYEHTGTPATGAAKARALLFKNKEFIKAEVAAWIDYNYINFDSHYNSTTCSRDVGYIIDAVCYDLITGSNFASSVAGMAYYRIQSSTVLEKQLIQTIEAITYAKTQALTYVQSAQVTATTAAFDNVISILSGNGLPTFTFPDDAHTDTNGHNSAATLQANRTAYQTGVETYLDTNYHTLWTSLSAGQKLTCKRDVGYIVDAVTYDILYGGNYQSVIAGNAYYSSGTLEIAAGEKAATLAAYNYLKTTLQADVHSSYSTTVGNLIDDITTIIDTNVPPSTIYPSLPGSGTLLTSFNALQAGKSTIQSAVITHITNTFSSFTYGALGTVAGAAKSARDSGLILDGAIFDMYYGGNEKSREYGLSFYNGTATYLLANEKTICVQALQYARDIAKKITTNTLVASPYQTAVTQVRDSVNYGTSGNATTIGAKFDIAINILANGAGSAPTLDPANYRIRGVSIRIAPGNYFENNPIIVPDSVSIIGDDLRSAVIRPLNANKDIFRVRNGVYMNGFTFRDHVNTAGVPDYTWNYTHAFDDVYDIEIDRSQWVWIGNDLPVIQQSPYVQNCSIISFLGGSGCLIDGSKVRTPNIPKYQIEAENPAVGDTPEQGKSMVGNAYTMLSFGGTGWHVINNAYSQIVGCFQIFLLNGIYAQSGGYISVTNSATNFGGFALRSSGYSDKSFAFDRGYIAGVGTVGGAQTVTVIGMQRVPLVQYVLRFFNPSNGNDITNSFKSSPVTISFNAATALTSGSSVFTINNHGLFTGNSVYYSRNGNTEINGLSDNGVYYVQVANVNQFVLYNDVSFQYQAKINSPGTGTHQFIKNPEEFYVSDINSSHSTYQKLTLTSGRSYTFIPGRAITGSTDIYTNNAYVYSYNDTTRELIISNEYTSINGSNERVKFTSDPNSKITQDHAGTPATDIAISSVQDYTGLYTAEVFPKSTIEGGVISSIGGLPQNKIAFHRPSIVNSSAHTWEYAGSGTDYNALPQNGGVPKPEYEQYSEAPGRVYVSGTNELGDFKVGNFITAENRSGLITFKSKVTVGELNVLKLTLSAVAINQISADVGLGDNEPGGASNQRISTQKAVRSFLANRLGSVIDKGVSTNAVPGALVQLNASGQINADLIPPQKAATTYQVGTWGGRLSLYNKIPPVDVQISDQANEKYYQQTLTLSNNVTATVGQVVTQNNRTGTGVVKYAVTGSNSVTIANVTGVFSTNVIDTILFDNVDSGYYLTNTGTAVEQSETYYLAVDNKSQFLTLTTAGSFTVGNTVIAAKNLAQGQITEYRAGVLYAVNNTGINGGTGYQPLTGSHLYTNVPLTAVTGSGTGAKADITVTNGAVTNVAVNFGGSGYAVGDLLSASASNLGGGIPSVTFTISVSRADTRLYVDLTGSNIKFAATSSSVDYIEDNSPPTKSITDLTDYVQKSFNAAASPTGSVDYGNSRITITGHGYSNGDPVIYSSGVNTAIGNLVSNTTYFVKRIDADTIELYLNYNLANKQTFGLSSTGTHTFRRYYASTDSFFFVIPNHGYTTGTPVRITGSTLPTGLLDNEYVYIGSITTNAFTLHSSRADALTSINGTTTGSLAITSTGAGSMSFITQNITINGVINTSSKSATNWNNLTATTIDASAIVSGTVSPTRLANTGTANNQTFLRGDSSWAYATASAKPATNSPISITGDFDTRAGVNYYHGDLTFDIAQVDGASGGPNYTNIGVASFNKAQFTVSTGQVSITQGVLDAATLGGFSPSYYLTPSNFIDKVPITKGGTNLTTYSKGDILYAPSTNSLAQLNIGTTGQILNVDSSGIPAWSNNADLPGYLNVQSTTQSNLTTNGSITTAGGVGIAKNINVGGSATIAGDITGSGALTVNSANKNVSLQPTGTGTVTINPSTKGAIDNVDIGTTTRGSAKVTTLAASGDTTVTSNTSSTSTSTGALVVSGGVGIGENLNVYGNTVIGGNLTVNGTTTTVNSTTTTIEDPIIDIGGGINGAAPSTNDAKDRGIKFQWHNGTVAKTGFFGYKNADGYFEFIPDASITGEVVTGTLGDFKAGTFRGNLVSSNVTITGGSINNTTIGATNASTGAFTTLTASGATTLTANTASTDTSTGTLVVTGGVGISGAVNSGSENTGALTATGNVTFNGSNAAISLQPTGTGTVTIKPTAAGTINNMSIGATTRSSGAFTTLTSNNATTFTAGTASTDTSTGTVVVTGGVGVSGNINAGGSISAGAATFTSVTDSGLTSGRVVFAGTGGLLTDSGTLTFNSGTLTVGTSVVAGGVTVGNANITLTGGNISGAVDITGSGTVQGAHLKDTSLTSGRIIFATTGGQLTDSSSLTWDGTTLTAGAFTTGGALSAGATNVTTLTASGAVSITDTTQSTSTITGALKVAGGVGIAKNIWIGGNGNVAGTFEVQSTFTADAAVNLNPANYSVSIAPTGTGSVTINPATVGSMDNIAIGTNTQASGKFTTLTAFGNFDASTVNKDVTLGASSGTGTTTINSGATGSINNINIGATTRGSGAFTTLAANGVVTLTDTTQSTSTTTGALKISGGVGVAKNVYVGGNLDITGTTTAGSTFTANAAVNLNPANYNVSIAPTGTGTATINPTVTGSIDNMSIGSNTPSTAKFTTLETSGNVTLNGNGSIINLTPTGSGYVTINPATTGTMDNVTIGTNVARAARFTNLTATTSASLSPSGTVTINPSTTSSVDNVNIGANTAGTGKFTTLTATGILDVTDTTQSTDTITGSIKTAGGVGIAKNLNVGGNAVITGNLTVQGTTTTVNSVVSTVQDPVIDIGGGLNGAAPTSNDSKDRGITFQYYDSAAKRGFFGFDAATGYFKYIANASLTGEVASGTLGDVQANNFRGNVIGGTGSFTTLTASGATTFTATTQSTGLSSGGVITSGGVAVAKNLNVGGVANFGLNNFNYGTIYGSQSGDPITIGSLGSDTNVSINITPQGAGIVTINSDKALRIPVGDTNARPSNPVPGLVRFNNFTTQFEGYNGVGWSSLGGVRDVAGTTYIIPELTPGSNDHTLWFYANGTKVGTWTETRLQVDSPGFRVPTGNTAGRPTGLYGDIRFNTETLQFEGFDGSNWSSLGGVRSQDSNTYISASNTGLSVYVGGVLQGTITSAGFNLGNINITGNTISATNTDGNVNIGANGTGVVKINGTGALQIPAGTIAQRPTGAQPGYIRYNTETNALEAWSQASNSFRALSAGLSDNVGFTTITVKDPTQDTNVITFLVGDGTPGSLFQNSYTVATMSTANGLLVEGKISIHDNVIENITPNEDLVIRANGTGRVIIDGSGSGSSAGNVFATDPLLTFNSGVIGTNTYDSGFIVNRGTSTGLNKGFVWSETDQEFKAIRTLEQGTVKGAITVSGYENVATASVKLNSETANKVTFTDASKVVRSLDSGRTAYVDGVMKFNTGAELAVPTGTSLQRPANPTDGSLRYNSTDQVWEGYANGGWGSLGIGIGSAVDFQGFVADGVSSNYTLNQVPLGAASIIVALNGVVQQPGTAYNVSGNILQFQDAFGNILMPDAGDLIDVRFLAKPAIGQIREASFVGDGTTTSYPSSIPIQTKSEILVFVNNVWQDKEVYEISGYNVVFTEAPANGDRINLLHIATIIAPNLITSAFHGFTKDSNGNLLYTKVSVNEVQLQDGNGNPLYIEQHIGTSDGNYSINSNGQLIYTYDGY